MAPTAVSPRAPPAQIAKKIEHSSKAAGSKAEQVKFATFDVTDQVFYRSADKSCYAIVNLKPIVPGHILVVPTEPYHRLSQVPPQVIASLFQSVQEISRGLEKVFEADAVTVSVQDGEAAGQTVPHLHVHVLPRKQGDITPNDLVYEHLEQWGFDTAKLLKQSDNAESKFKVDADEDRKPRSKEAMRQEASFLGSIFTADGKFDASRVDGVRSTAAKRAATTAAPRSAETTGISEPMQVAETFSEEFADMYVQMADDLEAEMRTKPAGEHREPEGGGDPQAGRPACGGAPRHVRDGGGRGESTDEYGDRQLCVPRAPAVSTPRVSGRRSARCFVVIQTEYIDDGEDNDDEDDAQSDSESEAQSEGDDDDDDEAQPQLNPQARLQAKNASETFAPLLRSKGFVWLATRPIMFGEWSQAGIMLTLQGGARWRCELGRRKCGRTSPRSSRRSSATFKSRGATARQEIVMIGKDMRHGAEQRLRGRARCVSAHRRRDAPVVCSHE
ncbi:hypothetical protein L1887_56900 [Cichorium endivia]|nr:hypothetical protein L1887_56900 [Cichorium endivia]